MVDINDTLYERYLLVSKLGKGGMGLVFKAIDQKTDELCAIKEISLRGMEPSEIFSCANEIIFLHKLKHENILVCYEHFQIKDYLYIVTEYCKDGDLDCVIRNAQNSLPADLIMNYTKQILNGLNYLHMQGIIHRDIKPQNIFINDNVLKIGDFGIAKMYEFTQRQIKAGTECYQAPEFCEEETTYGYECDIWSLGVTLFELYSLRLPFKTTKEKLLKELNLNDLPHNCPRWMKEVISSMLSKNKNERPSIQKIQTLFRQSATINAASAKAAKGFNISDMKCVKVFTQAHGNWISSLVLLTDDRFASGSWDNSIKIWNRNDFTCTKHIKHAHHGRISSLVLLSDESFVSASWDNSLKVWNKNDFKCLKHIKQAHDNWIFSLALYSDDYFVSGSYDNSIKVWNKNDFSCVNHMKHAHHDRISTLVLLSDGSLASGSWDNSIKIWNKTDFSCLKHIKQAHDNWISVLVSLSDDCFASASWDNSIKIWEINDFKCIAHIKGAHDDSISSLLLLSDELFASGSADNSIKLWKF